MEEIYQISILVGVNVCLPKNIVNNNQKKRVAAWICNSVSNSRYRKKESIREQKLILKKIKVEKKKVNN